MSVRMSVRRGPRQVTLARAESCPVCRQARAAGRMLCTDCCLDVERMLDPSWRGNRDERIPASIPVLWSELDPTPGVADPSGRSAPGFRSKPPLNLDVVVLRDRRSYPDSRVPVWYPPRADGKDDWSKPQLEPAGQARAVSHAVGALAESIREALAVPGPCPRMPSGAALGDGTVSEHCSWMLDRLAEVTALPHAGDIHDDLTALIDDLRGPAGDPPDRPVGACRGLIPVAGQHERVPCGVPLFLPPPRPGETIAPGQPVLRCGRCDKPYTALDLLRMDLGDQLAVTR